MHWYNASRVQVHESYQFEAKAYHNMHYHFRSIKTWLAGECRRWNYYTVFSSYQVNYYSHCPEHAWQGCKFNASKHSIFALGEGVETVLGEVDKDEQEAAYMQQQDTTLQNGTPSIVLSTTCPTLPSASPICVSAGQGAHPTIIPPPTSPTKIPTAKLGRSFVTCGGNAGHLWVFFFVAWIKLELYSLLQCGETFTG